MGGLISKGSYLDEVIYLSNQNITPSDLGIIQKDTDCIIYSYYFSILRYI